MAYASDARIQLLDEILGGIQIIKLYAWEESFEKLIKVLRRYILFFIDLTKSLDSKYVIWMDTYLTCSFSLGMFQD